MFKNVVFHNIEMSESKLTSNLLPYHTASVRFSLSAHELKTTLTEKHMYNVPK